MELAIRQAALDLYAESGWAGFTFEAIARRAKVGKPAIYLRWQNRLDLLMDCAATLDVPTTARDTGTFPGDLAELAASLFDWWSSPGARAWLRLQLDRGAAPELDDQFYEKLVNRNVAAARAIARRAAERFEITSFGSGVVAVEMLNGAIYTRLFNTPLNRRADVLAERDEFLARLVRMSAAAALVERGETETSQKQAIVR